MLSCKRTHSHTHTKAAQLIIADVGWERVGGVENCVSHSIRCNQSKHDSSNLHTCWCYFTHADQRSSWAWSAGLNVLLDSKAHPVHFGTKPAKIIFLLHFVFRKAVLPVFMLIHRMEQHMKCFDAWLHLPISSPCITGNDNKLDERWCGVLGEAPRFVGIGRVYAEKKHVSGQFLDGNKLVPAIWVKDRRTPPCSLSESSYSVWNFQGQLQDTLHSDMAAVAKFNDIYLSASVTRSQTIILLYERSLWADVALNPSLMKCRWSQCMYFFFSLCLPVWQQEPPASPSCTFTWALRGGKKKRKIKMNEAWLTHVASHWLARDFGLPITGCCLPSAWPQRPLLSAEPQTALGHAAGMDCRGMHYSADSGTAIQTESWVFLKSPGVF